jgi:hypothetical protein
VFESSRVLGQQGWRFTMAASMLEIYNEEYKDLLARKKLPDGRSHKVWACVVEGCVGRDSLGIWV